MYIFKTKKIKVRTKGEPPNMNLIKECYNIKKLFWYGLISAPHFNQFFNSVV